MGSAAEGLAELVGNAADVTAGAYGDLEGGGVGFVRIDGEVVDVDFCWLELDCLAFAG